VSTSAPCELIVTGVGHSASTAAAARKSIAQLNLSRPVGNPGAAMLTSSRTFRRTSSLPFHGLCSSGPDASNCASAVSVPIPQIVTDPSGAPANSRR